MNCQVQAKPMAVSGLHHVTAISGPARRNHAFYTEVLGLRLVKKTVNFDDPAAYHLYYGDAEGRPGTLLTFYSWENTAPGQPGTGETQQTAFRIPAAALDYWRDRFTAHHVPHAAPVRQFGETVLAFQDPDGTNLALIGSDDAGPGTLRQNGPASAWSGGGVPAAQAICGLHSVTLLLGDITATAAVLRDVFGYREIARGGEVTRFATQSGAPGSILDLARANAVSRGHPGPGSVHHIALRAASDAEQAAMVQTLQQMHGITTTAQLDRFYFRSVYFRAPGDVLFEISTDDPGFAVDEPPAELGQALKLPKFLEKLRPRIEATLRGW